MNAVELRKKIYDTVEPLLDGQPAVHFTVWCVKNSSRLNLSWFDSYGILITTIDIHEMNEEMFAYHIWNRFLVDEHDKRLEALATMHSSHTDEFGHFYKCWAEVEKVLQDFTRYLVGEFN